MKFLKHTMRGEMIVVDTDEGEFVYRADRFKNFADLKREIEKKSIETKRRKTEKTEKLKKMKKELTNEEKKHA